MYVARALCHKTPVPTAAEEPGGDLGSAIFFCYDVVHIKIIDRKIRGVEKKMAEIISNMCYNEGNGGNGHTSAAVL